MDISNGIHKGLKNKRFNKMSPENRLMLIKLLIGACAFIKSTICNHVRY